MTLRCVAILCVRNEELHIRRALDDLVAQGIDVAVIDHASTDRTREICLSYHGRGLVALEELAWDGTYDQAAQLRAKRALVERLDHDWVIHADADEWMHTRLPGETLLEGIRRIDKDYNAINFEEFVFLPPPDAAAGAADYKQRLLDYYFFAPSERRLMRAWKRNARLDNVNSGGHTLEGDEIRLAPENFVLRHYMVLSQAQAIAKYSRRVFAPADLDRGWHGNRIGLVPERLRLPASERLHRLRAWNSVELDRSQPRSRHFWDWTPEERGSRGRAAKLLVCVYTCESHEWLLQRFYESPVGVLLREKPDTVIVEVRADATLPHSRMVGDCMQVQAQERYEQLSIKTHRMIDLAVRDFEFQSLLKIDVTTVLSELDSPEYAGRKPMDLDALAGFLRDADYGQDYLGFMHHAHAGRDGAENWANKKGGRIDYERIFGNGPMPPFYSGKCYVISRRFAEYIALHGAVAAQEQAQYFLGSEDVMVGRLYQRFAASNPT
jgi:hypothetical protein